MSAAQDLMEVAGHAYTTLQPLMEPLNANLQIILDFDTRFLGVQVWVFDDTHNQALAHRSKITTIEQLDELVAEVQELASVTV